MNVKQGGWVAGVVSGVVVAVGAGIADRYFAKSTVESGTLIEVKVNVANLSKQFDDFAKQPYVRRDEYDRGYAGLDSRLRQLEGQIQQRSSRDR